MTFVYDYTSHMYNVEIRYSALYWWIVRSVKRQFSLWTLGSSTTHSSTGAVKYSCRKTTLQHNAAAGETTPSLHKPLFNSSRPVLFYLASSIMLLSSLHTSQHHPLFLRHFQSFSLFCFFFPVSCIHSSGMCICMTWTCTLSLRSWCNASTSSVCRIHFLIDIHVFHTGQYTNFSDFTCTKRSTFIVVCGRFCLFTYFGSCLFCTK